MRLLKDMAKALHILRSVKHATMRKRFRQRESMSLKVDQSVVILNQMDFTALTAMIKTTTMMKIHIYKVKINQV